MFKYVDPDTEVTLVTVDTNLDTGDLDVVDALLTFGRTVTSRGKLPPHIEPSLRQGWDHSLILVRGMTDEEREAAGAKALETKTRYAQFVAREKALKEETIALAAESFGLSVEEYEQRLAEAQENAKARVTASGTQE